MAQIAIPVLLLGAAYLISNDKDEKCKNEKEGLTNLSDLDDEGNLLSKEYKHFYPSIAKTENNVNSDQEVRQYQDKYFLKKISENKSDTNSDNVFESLSGNTIKTEDFNHNNMSMYGNKKTVGTGTINTASILDSYTGQGAYDIKKEEIATMFKPESNMQNVHGNQNQNDFLQSRVNVSQRHANSKPWEEVKVAPGLGKAYDEGVSDGYNNYNNSREMWLPKDVDQLRASNNPKNVYCLDDHMGPAIKPVTNMGVQGKIVKQSPDTYFVNKENLGMIAGTSGPKREVQGSQQMLTRENRDTTSVEYFGTRSNKDYTYVSGEYDESHRQQLPANPFINAIDKETNPTSTLNYGKQSYNVESNNRTTTKTQFFGGMKSAVSSITQPIINGLRHSKKTNTTTSLQSSGNVGGMAKQHSTKPLEMTNTTNREMYVDKLNMNHLNVQKQQSSAYMNTHPVLNVTQRNSMNQGEVGPASSHITGNMSYEAQYNQRNNNKIYAKNQKANGNMSLFNNKVVARTSNNEVCNSRSTPFYNPQPSSYQHPSDMLGETTCMPQNYSEVSSSQMDEGLLNAFKSNPYTQPLNSVA